MNKKHLNSVPGDLFPLTEKEKSVLQFIEQKLAEEGVSPSYQEIKDHFSFASFNSVQNYLKQLTAKGYIKIPLHQKRAIQVLNSANAVQKKIQEKLALLEPSSEIYSLPLLGRVAAGQPIEEMTHDEFIDAPPMLVRQPNKTFALQVKGSSMIEDGIHDGDLILVQKQENASNGEIVVATINDESTVKRYYWQAKSPRYSMPMVELRPANSALASMWYSPEDVQIQGIVVGLMRRF